MVRRQFSALKIAGSNPVWVALSFCRRRSLVSWPRASSGGAPLHHVLAPAHEPLAWVGIWCNTAALGTLDSPRWPPRVVLQPETAGFLCCRHGRWRRVGMGTRATCAPANAAGLGDDMLSHGHRLHRVLSPLVWSVDGAHACQPLPLCQLVSSWPSCRALQIDYSSMYALVRILRPNKLETLAA